MAPNIECRNAEGSAKWREETSQFSLTAAQALPLLAGGTSDVTASLTANPLSLTFQGKANISKDRFSKAI